MYSNAEAQVLVTLAKLPSRVNTSELVDRGNSITENRRGFHEVRTHKQIIKFNFSIFQILATIFSLIGKKVIFE